MKAPLVLIVAIALATGAPKPPPAPQAGRPVVVPRPPGTSPPRVPPPKRTGWPGRRPPLNLPPRSGTTPRRNIAVTVRVTPAPPHADRLMLEPSYPNPFHASTTIRYTVPRRGPCSVVVFDLAGQRIATLVEGVQEPGDYTLTWAALDDRGRRIKPGVYFLRAAFAGATRSRKLVAE